MGCVRWATVEVLAGVAGACSVPRTPHLASPLEGGRDEMGRGEVRGARGEVLGARFLPAQE